MAISGVTQAPEGEVVALGEAAVNGPVLIRAAAGNSGLVYVGNDGQGGVSAESGWPLAAGQELRLEFVGRLEGLYVFSPVEAQTVYWMILSV